MLLDGPRVLHEALSVVLPTRRLYGSPGEDSMKVDVQFWLPFA